jgi:hypothetical protein
MTLIEKLHALWPETYKGSKTLRGFEIYLSKTGNIIRVIVSQMYEFVDCSFKILKGLADIFGTESIDVEGYSTSGCETCDFGSSYIKTFIIEKATKHTDEI